MNATTHDKACTVCAYKITGEAHSFVNNKCACGRYNTVVVSFDLNLPTPEDGETLKIGPNPSSIAPITYTYGDRYLDAKYNLTVPKLADYSFVGWYTQKTGGEFIRISTTVSNSNAHTLYAQWVPNKINIQKLESKNIEVIENNGQNENDYKRDHAENGILNYDYSDTMITFGAEMIAKEEAEAEIPIVNDENNAANLSSWMTNAINKTGESVNNGVITFSWTADNTQDTVSPYGSLRHGVHARTYTIPGNTYKLEFDYMVSNPTPMVIGIENGGLIRTTPKANEWIHFEKEFTALNKQQDYENCYYNNLVFYTGDSTSQTLNIKNVKCGIMEAEAGLPDSYTYIWESKLPEGEWKQLDLKGVTGDKLNLIVKNATRDNNKAKIRLTVKNNAGDSITSNEATMTVYYLPEIE